MAEQLYVGATGADTHAFTVQAMIEKSIDRFSQRYSIFGGLGANGKGIERLVKTMDVAGRSADISTSSCVQTKVVDKGDEVRFTLLDDFKGLPTHGSVAVKEGTYPLFYHDDVRLNMFDSPAYPFWSEMDQQRFANLIANLEPTYQEGIGEYMGKWIDFLAFQSLFCGGDRGTLLTTDGGLGMQLMNAAAAGDIISCKNTYVGGNGMVTWNATRATFEASVATALDTLTDVTGDGFSLAAHAFIKNQIISVLRFKSAQVLGKQLRAVCLIDPWLLQRLMERSTNNVWFTMMRDADYRGADKNHAINQDQAVEIDKILYIPCEWIKAWRASTSGGLPVYGAGIDTDPQVAIATADTDSYLCPAIYLGAKALLHATSQKVYGAGTNSKKGGKTWFTADYGIHGKGGSWAAHMKHGFKRYEPMTKIGGTTTYLNNQSLIAWFYDPGPGVSFAA
ncbi:MAG TPA: DUF4043 family protein [Bacteroidales bacterium]|nr:DUF4043 family protein [Bacteroidales bacterium]